MIHVHIIHAKYLENRTPLFQMLINKLKEKNMLSAVTVYSDKDPNEIIGPDVGCFTNQPVPDGDKLAYFNSILKQMTLPQLSCGLKHLHVLRNIAKSQPSDINANDADAGADAAKIVNLVVEDDVLFSDNIDTQLKVAIAEFEKLSPKKILFLGVPSPASPEPTVRDFAEFYKVLPCCDSFLIDHPAAVALLAEYSAPPNRIRFVNNVQLTYSLLRLEIPIKILTPHIFVDGSKFGAVNSNIELNNKLILNPAYNVLAQAIDALPQENPANPTKRKPEIDQMFARFDFKNSPEYYFLKARYETKLGNIHFAKALFDFIYKTQIACGAPLTQGSEMMREYMKIFKYLQK